jgi:hypothetical protein
LKVGDNLYGNRILGCLFSFTPIIFKISNVHKGIPILIYFKHHINQWILIMVLANDLKGGFLMLEAIMLNCILCKFYRSICVQ